MNSVVFDAIKALLDEGKTPTVALTKSRLAQPVPMPMIIAAVSQYKNNPDKYKLLGDFKDQWRLVGNAVPPLLAKVISKEIKKQLF